GAGNNIGIQYAKDNYKFDFLAVSNADIEIENLDKSDFEGLKDCIVAPNIIKLNNEKQNPMHYRRNKFGEYLKFQAFKYNRKYLLYSVIALEKIERTFFSLINSWKKNDHVKIFAGHGSFIIFSELALKRLGCPFDEKIF